MIQEQRPGTDFEQRLLDQLRAVVAERGAAEAASEAAGGSVAMPAWRRSRPRLAFAGAGALAAIAAGILAFSSGPNAQPAAAEVLHEAAAIAVSPDAPTSSPLPGPGQFLYTKVKRIDLQGWIPNCGPGMNRPCSSIGATMSGPDAFNALMPTTQEEWLGEDGAGRYRQVAGTPRLLTSEEQSRWKAAGSPLPPPFDPVYQRKVLEYQRKHNYPSGYGDSFGAGQGVVDSEHGKWQGFHFPDTSSLPTEPAALRRVIEEGRVSESDFQLGDPAVKPLDNAGTIAGLLNILSEGNPMTPQLRAAAFNALAEMPGIEVDTDATDFLGRHGYAIKSIPNPKTGDGVEFIFDPDTAAVLAKRGFIGKPRQSSYLKDLPAGSTLSETAYLESAVVDSTDEVGASADAGGPVATTTPSDRK